MKLDGLDQELKTLHDASERISSNLVELEVDSTRQLLEASRLEGESAARWSAAGAALTELWRRQGLLEGVLQRADKLRAQRHADELHSILEGGSIELESADVPLARRDLLGSSRATRRCSPGELLESMSTSFDEVRTVLSEIGHAWEELIPKLDIARAHCREAHRFAENVGGSSRHDLESATKTLEVLERSVTKDPLAVSPADVDQLVRELQAIAVDLQSAAALKRKLGSALLDARELLERLRAEAREAQAAHEEVLRKIALSAAPPAPEVPGDLEAELNEVADMAGNDAWREARHALEKWLARIAASREAIRRTLAANRAPIEERDQFRALLDAYRAKAKRLGVLEDAEVERIFIRAQDVLYTAPTDLAEAAELVRSYQRSLNEALPAPEAML